MTPIEELIEIIKDKRKESDISNTLLRFCQTEAEKLLEREKKESISFGIWLSENASQVSKDAWGVFDSEWLTVSESYELFKRQRNNLI